MGHMAHGGGNIDDGAVLKHVVKMSNVFATGGATLIDNCYRIHRQQIAHRGVKSDIYNCLI